MSPAAGSISTLVASLWLLNVVLDTGGQLAFKAAAGDPHAGDGLARWKHMAARPWLWFGVASYVIEFLVWIAFLSLVPLSEGVLLGSINIVAIMIAGRFLFGEKLTRMRVLGILLVTLGVVIVGVAG
ncbi:MAG: EamA family transporter [Rhodanobacter sp.]|jgi:drug/metabolite transporter (DMT)-like permease|nr:EamA family transporter [Rhodanobacter sp.]